MSSSWRFYGLSKDDNKTQRLRKGIGVIIHRSGCAESEAVTTMMEYGLYYMAENDLVDESEKEEIATYKMLSKAMSDIARDQTMRKVVRYFGPEEIKKRLADNGVERTLEEIAKTDKKSDVDKVPDWIMELLSDGVPHSVGEIVSTAIADGILPPGDDVDFQSAHNSFKIVACRMGVSGGKKGYWQLPKELSD